MLETQLLGPTSDSKLRREGVPGAAICIPAGGFRPTDRPDRLRTKALEFAKCILRNRRFGSLRLVQVERTNESPFARVRIREADEMGPEPTAVGSGIILPASSGPERPPWGGDGGAPSEGAAGAGRGRVGWGLGQRGGPCVLFPGKGPSPELRE